MTRDCISVERPFKKKKKSTATQICSAISNRAKNAGVAFKHWRYWLSVIIGIILVRLKKVGKIKQITKMISREEPL